MFTSYTSAPQVYLDGGEVVEYQMRYFAGFGEIYQRTVTTEHYEYRGLTEAAAKTDTATLATSLGDTAQVVWRRENEGGMYCIDVTVVTKGDWSAVAEEEE